MNCVPSEKHPDIDPQWVPMNMALEVLHGLHGMLIPDEDLINFDLGQQCKIIRL